MQQLSVHITAFYFQALSALKLQL